jgi:uncharacterized delta-60 repeat protein
MTKFSALILNSTLVIILTACGGSSSSSSNANAQQTTTLQGILDTTFGSNGFITHHNAASEDGDDSAGSIVRDGSGNLYISGESFNGTDEDMVIWKYKSDGVLDTSFGTNGIVTYDNLGENPDQSETSLSLDASGNIYVSVLGFNDYNYDKADMSILKYTSDGVLDTSFGANGVIYQSNAQAGVKLDKNGNIYMVGYSGSNHNTNLSIWKYANNGVLDSSFGSNGKVTYVIGGDNRGESFTFDSSGNIYVGGTSYINNEYSSYILKYSSTGVLDTNFGDNGIVINSDNKGGEFGADIALDSNENIYFTVTRNEVTDIMQPGISDIVIRKYSSNGKLDTTFGTNGIVQAYYGAGAETIQDFGYVLLFDKKDNFYLSGQSIAKGVEKVRAADDLDMVIWKFNSNGQPDTSFSDDGVFTISPSISAFGMAFDENGHLFVAGVGIFNEMDTDMVVWKIK